MVSKNAATRQIAHDTAQDTAAQAAHVPGDVARNIAAAWMDIATTEHAMMPMGRSAIIWQAAPPVQNAMAAIAADLIDADTNVFCVGFQAYGWMNAGGATPADVMRCYLGKTLPGRVMPASAGDAMNMMQKGRTNIVALHVESAAGWNDVRAVTAAAVKNEAPMIMIISAAVPMPEGVAIDMMPDLPAAIETVRAGIVAVRGAGAIRVIAVEDMTPADIERAMMEAARMTPSSWIEMMEKNIDGAETVANAAYQSPVESF